MREDPFRYKGIESTELEFRVSDTEVELVTLWSEDGTRYTASVRLRHDAFKRLVSNMPLILERAEEYRRRGR